MATTMRSEFLGRTVQSNVLAPKASAKKFQVQALFKKAEKKVDKKAKQTQQSAKAKLPSATQFVKKAQKAVQKNVPSAPAKKQTQKTQQAPKKAASQAKNLFQGAKQQGKKAGKQAGKQASKQTGGTSKGWFGEERASGLDRWYGECAVRYTASSVCLSSNFTKVVTSQDHLVHFSCLAVCWTRTRSQDT